MIARQFLTEVQPALNGLREMGQGAVAGHQLGGGEADVEVFAGTAAHAHLLALDRLQQGRPIGGRAYFITQDDPRPLRDITARFLRAAGLRATWCTVPTPLAQAAAATCENFLRLTGRAHTHALSRFLVAELVHPHLFSIEAARRDLGFEPPITFDAGITALRRAT